MRQLGKTHRSLYFFCNVFEPLGGGVMKVLKLGEGGGTPSPQGK